MFLFNKNSALPRSRQSSVDSHATDSPSAESWVPPQNDAASYRDMGSPERRERSFGKRNSVFTLRSRGNTSVSTNSPFVSPTSTITSTMTSTDMSSRRSSQDLSLASSQSSLQPVPAQKRSLFSRGKKLRRQSSQITSLSVLGGIEEPDTGRRYSLLRKDRKLSRYGPQSPVYDIKEHISSPFDFQHLTHTHRQQFPALEHTTQNELVAEFWAVRASQIPSRELHGIKADDLHFQNFSSEAVNSTSPIMRPNSSLAKSPPLSPQSREPSARELPSPISSVRPALRHSRSVESFSQPVVKARHRLSHSVNPPPRTSSRTALERIDDVRGEPPATGNSVSLRSRYSRAPEAWDRSAPPSRPSTAGSISTVTAEPFIAQAFTTPDDTAIPALSPAFTTDLENVPEEPERFFNPRPAPRPPLKSPPIDVSFRSPQWSPVSRSTSRTSSYGTPKSFSQRSSKPRPTSQMSDTLGSPIQLRSGRSSIRQSPAAKRQSVYWKNIDESWEDDIDYCYDHAAEADCDYEWDRNSVECDEENQGPASSEAQQGEVTQSPTQSPISEQDEDEVLQTRFFPGAFRPSLLVPSASSLPELDHRSAISSSTTDAGALTPLDIFSSAPIRDVGINAYMDPEGFSLTPSLLVPQDFKYQSMREEMYEDLLTEYEHSEQHYPILDAAQSVSGSSRSSRTRLSKRSSYDSSLLSGQGSISSPVRRSASSSGSLPELVHSRRGRKTLDLMVDQLTEQSHTFAHLDEDDEGEPRPSTATERTFFADDDDHTPTQDEDSQKLEPVSAPTTAPAPSAPAHHERAASEGAAKLLSSASRAPASSPKTRTRAASAATSYKPKQQSYTLSLFPAPPKARKATP